MNTNWKYIWIAILSIWLSTAMAVSIGIYYTHNANCLWAMLIPSFMSIKNSKEKDEDN